MKKVKLSFRLITSQLKITITTHYSQYFTATILEWKHLLKPDKYKDVIIDSLKFLVKEKWVEVNVFTLMSNHIHLTRLPAGRHGKYKTDMREKLYREIF